MDRNQPQEMALKTIRAERIRQDRKWGEQNHDPVYWLGIVGEEYGELCKAVIERDGVAPKERYFRMRKELIHVAAVAVAALECLTRNQIRDDWFGDLNPDDRGNR